METKELRKFCKKANKLKSTMPITDNILVSKGQLVVTDLKHFIVYNPPEIDPDIKCLINFKTFKKIVDKVQTIDIIPGDTVELETDKGTYSIKQDQDVNDFPDFPDDRMSKKDILSTEDVKTIKKAVHYTAKDELRPVMECVLIDDNHIVATDAHKLLYKKRKGSGHKFLINKFVASLFEDKQHEVFADNKDQWIGIWDNLYEYWYVQEQGTYPQWKAVIPDTNNVPAKIKVKSKDFKEALEAAEPVLPSIPKMRMQSNVKQNKLNLYTKDLDFDVSYNTDVPAQCDGESITIGINQKFMLQILKTEKYEEVEIKMFNPDKAMIINDEVLLMPVDIDFIN
jgi:DNA polymerase III sliding clamp (beta) subunit (PCNA family)